MGAKHPKESFFYFIGIFQKSLIEPPEQNYNFIWKTPRISSCRLETNDGSKPMIKGNTARTPK